MQDQWIDAGTVAVLVTVVGFFVVFARGIRGWRGNRRRQKRLSAAFKRAQTVRVQDGDLAVGLNQS